MKHTEETNFNFIRGLRISKNLAQTTLKTTFTEETPQKAKELFFRAIYYKNKSLEFKQETKQKKRISLFDYKTNTNFKIKI